MIFIIEPLSIRRNFLWNTTGCLIYQGCQWAITVIVVILSANYENSGTLAFAMAVGNVFATIATYNVRTYQVSDIDNRFSSSNYIAFRFLTILLAFVIMGFYLGLTSSGAMIPTVICYLVFKADESFCNVFYAIEQKAQRMDYIGISQGIRGVFALSSFSLVLHFSQNLNFAIIVMSLLCIAVTLTYDRNMAKRLSIIKPVMSLAKMGGLFITCLPAVLTLCCFGAVVMFARQIFEYHQGTEALGIYAAVATPTVIVQVAASYLYAPFISEIAKDWVAARKKKVIATLLKVIGIIFVVFAVIFAGAFLFGDALLTSIFGEGIMEYTYLLLPALFATAFAALTGFLLDVLIVFRDMRGALIANFLALVTSLTVAGPAIEQFGMNGINVSIICAFGIGLMSSIAFLLIDFRRMS